MVDSIILTRLPLLSGRLLDLLLGDPSGGFHPIVAFGKIIGRLERLLNRGVCRRIKGAVMAPALVGGVFFGVRWCLTLLGSFPAVRMLVEAAGVFFCLAGTTLAREVRGVFEAADRSLCDGRRQVSRIVGRDTAALSRQEVLTAALETLAENLSDGVVAPLFWYILLGLPGMMAYKMVNTLDSMIGYRNERYGRFGTVAARIDDVANYLPARITALLMIVVAGRPGLLRFVVRYGPEHSSPNSGWPEAALAGILNCRFGGPHDYFGEPVYKPFIGSNDRLLTSDDMERAIRVTRRVEVAAVILAALLMH